MNRREAIGAAIGAVAGACVPVAPKKRYVVTTTNEPPVGLFRKGQTLGEFIAAHMVADMYERGSITINQARTMTLRELRAIDLRTRAA